MSTPSILPKPPAQAKRARRKDARPAELIEAAFDLFVEKGYSGTTVHQVAEQAGVSKGTLFLYFSSKEDLFKAVVRSAGVHFEQWSDELARYEGPSSDLLRTCLARWWEQIGATKASGITKLMMTEGRLFPEVAADYEQHVITPGKQLICQVLQRGINRGEFRQVNLDLTVHTIQASLLYLLMSKHGLLGCTISSPASDQATEYLKTQADLLLRGLAA